MRVIFDLFAVVACSLITIFGFMRLSTLLLLVSLIVLEILGSVYSIYLLAKQIRTMELDSIRNLNIVFIEGKGTPY